MGETDTHSILTNQRVDTDHVCTNNGTGLANGLDTSTGQYVSAHCSGITQNVDCHQDPITTLCEPWRTPFKVSVNSSQYTGGFDILEDPFESLPDHIIIEILVKLPTSCWASAACVRKRWASLFRGDMLWQTALLKRWPRAGSDRRWPGPIGRGPIKRRYIALHVSESLFKVGNQYGDIHELVGHVYLFLREQLEVSMPLSYGLLHGTVIDQFLACGKAGSAAHELASLIWLAVLDKLEDNEQTFHLLMRIAKEWEIFLPYPYSKSHAVQWRLFERLFTDFRDLLSQFDYYNVLTQAKYHLDFIPSTWLGY